MLPKIASQPWPHERNVNRNPHEKKVMLSHTTETEAQGQCQRQVHTFERVPTCIQCTSPTHPYSQLLRLWGSMLAHEPLWEQSYLQTHTVSPTFRFTGRRPHVKSHSHSLKPVLGLGFQGPSLSPNITPSAYPGLLNSLDPQASDQPTGVDRSEPKPSAMSQ